MSNVPPDYNRLGPPAGQSILIVGGCGGIGRALVLAAVDIGLDVMVMDLAGVDKRHRPARWRASY